MIHRPGSTPAPLPQQTPDFIVGNCITTDAAEQATYLHGWNQRYEQLSPGPFEGHVTEVCFSDVQLFRERSTRSIQESCQVEGDTFVIGIPIHMDGYGWCDGWQVDLDTLLMHRPGHDLLFRTSNRLDLVAVSLPQRDLVEHARIVDKLEVGPTLQRAAHALRSPKLAAELRNFLVTMMDSLNATPSMLAHAAIRKGLKEAVLSSVISIIGNAAPENATPRTSAGRQQIVSRAIDHMRTRIDEPLSISDLCTVLGVSRRTLQYCFEEALQVNPVSYLRALRLNGVRKEIKRSDAAGLAIQDVAARWGFWHLSRFAQEYRQMFGELPSETLRATSTRQVGGVPAFGQGRH